MAFQRLMSCLYRTAVVKAVNSSGLLIQGTDEDVYAFEHEMVESSGSSGYGWFDLMVGCSCPSENISTRPSAASTGGLTLPSSAEPTSASTERASLRRLRGGQR